MTDAPRQPLVSAAALADAILLAMGTTAAQADRQAAGQPSDADLWLHGPGYGYAGVYQLVVTVDDHPQVEELREQVFDLVENWRPAGFPHDQQWGSTTVAWRVNPDQFRRATPSGNADDPAASSDDG